MERLIIHHGEGHIKESMRELLLRTGVIKGMTGKEWQRTVEGGARCRRVGMCVNGASRVAGGSGWSVYRWCRVGMYFSFFCGNEMVWGL